MTQTAAFLKCRPLSLLVKDSAAFIQSQRNISLLNNIIWGTCNTDVDKGQCLENMDWFAQNIKTQCKRDIDADNPIVQDAVAGLEAYGLMREVGCQVNTQTNTYCYVEAAQKHPSDLYLYALPLGLDLPNKTVPSCTSCVQNLMHTFVTDGLNLTVLRQTYSSAATIVNDACGAEFVSTMAGSTNGARSLSASGWYALDMCCSTPISSVSVARLWQRAYEVNTDGFSWSYRSRNTFAHRKMSKKRMRMSYDDFADISALHKYVRYTDQFTSMVTEDGTEEAVFAVATAYALLQLNPIRGIGHICQQVTVLRRTRWVYRCYWTTVEVFCSRPPVIVHEEGGERHAGYASQTLLQFPRALILEEQPDGGPYGHLYASGPVLAQLPRGGGAWSMIWTLREPGLRELTAAELDSPVDADVDEEG
ncbi:hypothetical protein NUW54_g12089 [Trametes sanguinea]|uniref:Uncharacterized protein n=1 Tax=Trametes sanguinea TaxID=158606 RepID=A0ACC1N1Z6_9APHY|nr:hypothetical protein NUW54_g12089 [Trametes sanguinea]